MDSLQNLSPQRRLGVRRPLLKVPVTMRQIPDLSVCYLATRLRYVFLCATRIGLLIRGEGLRLCMESCLSRNPGYWVRIILRYLSYQPRLNSWSLFSAKDSEVILWDLAKKASNPNEFVIDGQILASLSQLSKTGVQGDLTALHWSADGQLLAIGSYDSVLRVATKKGVVWMSSPLHEVCAFLDVVYFGDMNLAFLIREGSYLCNTVFQEGTNASDRESGRHSMCLGCE